MKCALAKSNTYPMDGSPTCSTASIEEATSGRKENGTFSIHSEVFARLSNGTKSFKRRVEIGNQLVSRRGAQNVGFARCDDDTRNSQIAGAVDEHFQNPKAVSAHLGKSACNVEIDIRYVHTANLRSRINEVTLKGAPRLVVHLRRPKMARMGHELKIVKSQTRKPIERSLCAHPQHIRVRIDGELGQVFS